MYSDSPTSMYALVLLGTAVYLLRWLKESTYKSVPTVGPTAPLLSYWGAIRFMNHAREMLEEGHVKYGGRPFRFATRKYWHYVVSDPKLIDELRRAPDDQLSFSKAVDESLELEYTMGAVEASDMYHIPIIRTTLTRNLGNLSGEIYDEIQNAFAHCIPLKNEWTAVPALNTMMQVVARTSSRIFVGLPLCRDPEFLHLSINYTTDVVMTGLMLNMVPGPLKPFVNYMINRVDKLIDRVEVLLRPIIEERRSMMEQYGEDWPDKPNDMLQWLMDTAEGAERETRALVARVLVIGFAAIHTSSMSFTQALYRLAAHPEYIKPMREEVETIVARDGWSKDSLNKMHKVDSFLKENQRCEGLGCLFLNRKALKDYTFSDGTFIPKGSYVSTSKAATHSESGYYTNPYTFDPWRFASLRDKDGESVKHQMVNTSVEYLTFGLGKHACPGRFFAANELKSMMAHIVTTYDVSMEKLGELPESIRFFGTTSPDRTASVLFRKRQD